MNFYIFEDYSDLESLPLLNIEWTLIIQFYFLIDLLRLCFFTRTPLFSPHLMKRKRSKYQLFNYFWRMLLTFEEKMDIHKHTRHLIIWIFKKLNSIQTIVKDIPEIKLTHWSLLGKTYKKPHSVTQTLFALNKFILS